MELRHGTDARECANELHWLAVAARASTLGLNLEVRICHHWEMAKANRYDYINEKREALAKWDAYLTTLLQPRN